MAPGSGDLTLLPLMGDTYLSARLGGEVTSVLPTSLAGLKRLACGHLRGSREAGADPTPQKAHHAIVHAQVGSVYELLPLRGPVRQESHASEFREWSLGSQNPRVLAQCRCAAGEAWRLRWGTDGFGSLGVDSVWGLVSLPVFLTP